MLYLLVVAEDICNVEDWDEIVAKYLAKFGCKMNLLEVEYWGELTRWRVVFSVCWTGESGMVFGFCCWYKKSRIVFDFCCWVLGRLRADLNLLTWMSSWGDVEGEGKLGKKIFSLTIALAIIYFSNIIDI